MRNGILVSAGRAETAVASERDKFKFAAMGTAVRGTAKSWITTVDHLLRDTAKKGKRELITIMRAFMKNLVYKIYINVVF